MFFGGFCCSSQIPQASDKVDIYNSTTNTWSSTTMSMARGHGSATGVGDVIIFAGGMDQFLRPQNTINIYNIVTGQWTSASLSVARVGMAAVTVGTTALFAGGASGQGCNQNCDRDDGVQSSRVDVYNATDGTWSTSALSEARSYLAATTLGTKAFFAGGDISGGLRESSKVDIYDSISRIWTNTDFPGSLRERTLLGAAASGGAVIFLGGSDRARTSPSNLIDIYEVDTGVWRTGAAATGRYWMASATVGDYAIFAGGLDSTERDAVEMIEYKKEYNPELQVAASTGSAGILMIGSSGAFRVASSSA
jgi:hypothetical protein